MERSESINELALALSKAQGEITGAIRESSNPAFRGAKYADLSAVWEGIRGPFAKHGLSVVQGLSSVEGGVHCETMLMHSSGQWVSSGLTIPADKLNAHGYGSAATYARRFGLQAIAGIAPIDDDGNAAVETTPKTDPAIMKAAKTAAECGADAFRKYWASIPQNIRAQLRDHISELQAIAKTADEENNQAQARQNDD
jgi:hypothetical protein